MRNRSGVRAAGARMLVRCLAPLSRRAGTGWKSPACISRLIESDVRNFQSWRRRRGRAVHFARPARAFRRKTARPGVMVPASQSLAARVMIAIRSERYRNSRSLHRHIGVPCFSSRKCQRDAVVLFAPLGAFDSSPSIVAAGVTLASREASAPFNPRCRLSNQINRRSCSASSCGQGYCRLASIAST